MSVVQALHTGLVTAATGLERARQMIAAAVRATNRIAIGAAAYGFVGISRNVSRLQAAIREISTAVSSVSRHVDDAARAVASASGQPTPQQTLALLESVSRELESVRRMLGPVMEAIDAAKQVAAEVLRGGQPGPMLARLEAVHTVMLAVAQRTDQAQADAAAALALARTTGDEGSAPGYPSPQSSEEPIPSLIRELGGRLPVRAADEAPAAYPAGRDPSYRVRVRRYAAAAAQDLHRHRGGDCVTTFDVTWGGDTTGGQDQVTTVEQIDQALHGITTTPRKLPYSVAIVIQDGSRYPVTLEIGVGHPDRSFAYWVGPGDDDAAWAFQPDLAPVDGIVIDYAGQATELWPERSRVSAEAAREAARIFVATGGRRPDNLSWDDE